MKNDQGPEIKKSKTKLWLCLLGLVIYGLLLGFVWLGKNSRASIDASGKLELPALVFMDVPRQGSLEKTLEFKWEGKEAIELQSVSTDCTCLKVSIIKGLAKKGGSLKIKLLAAGINEKEQWVKLKTNQGNLRFPVSLRLAGKRGSSLKFFQEHLKVYQSVPVKLVGILQDLKGAWLNCGCAGDDLGGLPRALYLKKSAKQMGLNLEILATGETGASVLLKELSIKTGGMPSYARSLHAPKFSKGIALEIYVLNQESNKLLERFSVFLDTSIPREPATLKSIQSYLDKKANQAWASLESNQAWRKTGETELLFFYTPGCQKCRWAEKDLEALKKSKENLKVTRLNLNQEQNKLLLLTLEKQNGISDDKVLLSPVIIGAGGLLLRDAISATSLEQLVDNSGGYAFDAKARASLKLDNAGLEQTFISWKGSTILLAAFLDGINPCAFSVMIFLMSFLALVGKKGWGLFTIGAAFCLGIFTAYLGIGLGGTKLLSRAEAFPAIGMGLNLGMGLVLVFLAVFSFRDATLAKRGRLKEMSLTLSDKSNVRMRKWITKWGRGRYLLPLGFFLGLGVSLIEFACTGQVYLPMLQLMVQDATLKSQALFWLILYNLVFILPLVLLLLLCAFGTGTQMIGKIYQRYITGIKVGLGLCFLGASAWLIWLAL